MGSYSDQAADGDMLCKDEARCCSCTGTPAAGAQGCHAATGALFLHASIISPISTCLTLTSSSLLLHLNPPYPFPPGSSICGQVLMGPNYYDRTWEVSIPPCKPLLFRPSP